MKKRYTIQLETTGAHETKREFNDIVALTDKEYLDFVTVILAFINGLEKQD